MSSKETAAARTAVADAEAKLAELQERRTHLLERRAELDTERQSVSYAALAQHDAAANKRLGEIADAISRHDGDLKALDYAIGEADKRLELARRSEAVAIDKQKARRIRVCLNKFMMTGRTLDDALTVLVEASADMKEALSEMHSLGCPYPSHDQLAVLGERALRTGLHQTIWSRYFEIVPPNERKTFVVLVQAWAATVENNIRPRLEQTTPEAA
jgi:hypothetical protein